MKKLRETQSKEDAFQEIHMRTSNPQYYKSSRSLSKVSWKSIIIMILLAILTVLAINAEARGNKKKRRRNTDSTPCAALGLDCSDTCCLTDHCAKTLSDTECSKYYKRPY